MDNDISAVTAAIERRRSRRRWRVEADDEATRAIERGAIEPTDNGWRDGDPLDQPDNPETPWELS